MEQLGVTYTLIPNPLSLAPSQLAKTRIRLFVSPRGG